MTWWPRSTLRSRTTRCGSRPRSRKLPSSTAPRTDGLRDSATSSAAAGRPYSCAASALRRHQTPPSSVPPTSTSLPDSSGARARQVTGCAPNTGLQPAPYAAAVRRSEDAASRGRIQGVVGGELCRSYATARTDKRVAVGRVARQDRRLATHAGVITSRPVATAKKSSLAPYVGGIASETQPSPARSRMRLHDRAAVRGAVHRGRAVAHSGREERAVQGVARRERHRY